jgi:hypothetical protein
VLDINLVGPGRARAVDDCLSSHYRYRTWAPRARAASDEKEKEIDNEVKISFLGEFSEEYTGVGRRRASSNSGREARV